MNLQEQIDNLRTEIEHHQSTVKACQEKIKPLRATMEKTNLRIKELKKKRRKLILSKVGIHHEH